MIIAEQKKNENIAEYLLYMYQVEDMIRANQFDISKIEKTIISKFETSYDVKREMFEWYKSLIDHMKEEGKMKSGHLDFLNRIAGELNGLHISMLNDDFDTDYKSVYGKARPNIEALRMRSGHTGEHDVQVSLNGIYGLLILRLQKKEISKETDAAFATITELIALLSARYMEISQSAV